MGNKWNKMILFHAVTTADAKSIPDNSSYTQANSTRMRKTLQDSAACFIFSAPSIFLCSLGHLFPCKHHLRSASCDVGRPHCSRGEMSVWPMALWDSDERQQHSFMFYIVNSRSLELFFSIVSELAHFCLDPIKQTCSCVHGWINQKSGFFL